MRKYTSKYNFVVWFKDSGYLLRNKIGEKKFWQEFDRAVEQERPSINFLLAGMTEKICFIFIKKEKRKDENGTLYDRYYFNEV